MYENARAVPFPSSLPPQHKLLFSILMSLNVLESERIITPEQTRFLLSPATVPSRVDLASARPNPCRQLSVDTGALSSSIAASPLEVLPEGEDGGMTVLTGAHGGEPALSDEAWLRVLALNALEGMHGVDDLITSKLGLVCRVLDSSEPYAALGAVTVGDTSGFMGQLPDDDKRLHVEGDTGKRSLREDLLFRLQPLNEKASPRHPQAAKTATLSSPTRAGTPTAKHTSSFRMTAEETDAFIRASPVEGEERGLSGKTGSFVGKPG